MGEFRDRLELAELADVLERMELEADELDPDEDVEAEQLPGYADGDYPESLQQTMLTWFPVELAVKYGQRYDTVLRGDFLEIPGDSADDAAADLRRLGHTVERSDLPFS